MFLYVILIRRIDCGAAVNKQLNDKERVAAAFENPNLVDLVEKCLVSTEE